MGKNSPYSLAAGHFQTHKGQKAKRLDDVSISGKCQDVLCSKTWIFQVNLIFRSKPNNLSESFEYCAFFKKKFRFPSTTKVFQNFYFNLAITNFVDMKFLLKKISEANCENASLALNKMLSLSLLELFPTIVSEKSKCTLYLIS